MTQRYKAMPFLYESVGYVNIMFGGGTGIDERGRQLDLT